LQRHDLGGILALYPHDETPPQASLCLPHYNPYFYFFTLFFMATFTFSFSYPDDAVLEFAKFLSYPETVDEYTTDENGNRTRTEVPNPQSANDFLAQKGTEHINLFTTQHANYRKSVDIQAKSQEVAKAYDDGIIAQIKSSLTSTVE
jgi:hypothetical protein